jgi:pseudomonalisin
MRGVNSLCSSPYSVCVGGTQFNDTSNPGQYWLPGNNSVMGSAQSYIPGVVWNQSGSNGGSGLWAGGGGASSVYSKPSWQTGPGVPADGQRDVPDVSLTGSSYDGYLITCGGQLWVIGGTIWLAASDPSMPRNW